jgi:hypothetical protein
MAFSNLGCIPQKYNEDVVALLMPKPNASVNFSGALKSVLSRPVVEDLERLILHRGLTRCKSTNFHISFDESIVF